MERQTTEKQPKKKSILTTKIYSIKANNENSNLIRIYWDRNGQCRSHMPFVAIAIE